MLELTGEGTGTDTNIEEADEGEEVIFIGEGVGKVEGEVKEGVGIEIVGGVGVVEVEGVAVVSVGGVGVGEVVLLPVELGAGVIGVGGVRTGVVPGVGVETPEGGGVAFPIEGVPIPIGVDTAGGVGGVSPEGVGTVEG